MLRDRFGATHSTSSHAAVAAFEAAVQAIAAHRPIGPALQDALMCDRDLVAAHALLGFGNVILGRSETLAQARQIRAAADRCLQRCGGGTRSEQTLIEALRLAVDGHLVAAADRLDVHLHSTPCDFLAVKLSHALRFMSGQSAQMLALTRRVLPSWQASDAAYGFVLGCHAFGLEEGGHYVEAERFGREAYAHEKADAWGLHAVSHVMEMSRRTSEGVEWLQSTRENWSLCNNFSFHLGWHLALLRLEQGDVEAVLEVYDRDIRPIPSDDFRDMANATSILWRLELEGVAVGTRWAELHAIAARRRRDVSYVFGSLHYLLALVAQGDAAGAAELLAGLREIAANPGHDQAAVAAELGVPLAKIIIAMTDEKLPSGDLLLVASRLTSLGGSHAQRDVFMRTLLMAAASRGEAATVAALSRIRHSIRSTDRFISMIDRRLGNKLRSTERPISRLAS